MSIQEKTDLLRTQLLRLNLEYGVTITFIAQGTGIATQHLTNFKNEKLEFGWKRLTQLDIFLQERYKQLLTGKGDF